MSLLRHRMPTSLATHCLSTSCFSPVPRQDTYFQGQYSDDGRREYFYYVDHQGRVRGGQGIPTARISCSMPKELLRNDMEVHWGGRTCARRTQVYAYIFSISSAYFFQTMYRFTFRVGPNSPPAMLRSLGMMVNFLTV